jgi:hypothetical protein
VHSQPGGRDCGEFVDIDQFDLAVMHIRVVDLIGGSDSDARIFGYKDGTRQLLAQYRDRIDQIEYDLLDYLPCRGVDEHRTVGTDREAR